MKKILYEKNSSGTGRAPVTARLPHFIGMPEDALERLAGFRVIFLGCGSVGRTAALHLARLQLARILLVDPKKLKAESLLTHLASPGDVGEPKAGNLGRIIKDLSPSTQVFVHEGTVQDLDLTVFTEYDLVMLASDNIAAEVAAGQRCLWLGLPLIQASLHGPTLVAQVRFFSNRDGSGACPVCGFSRAEWDALNLEKTFSCDGRDSWVGTESPSAQPPTMSVSFLSSISAELALMQMLRYRLSLGQELEDSMLEYCAFTHKMVNSPLRRNPDCACDHTCYQPSLSRNPIMDCSLRQLAETAGVHKGGNLEGVSFRLDNLTFGELGSCACKADHPLMQFTVPGHHAGRCGTCKKDIKPHLFFSHDPVPASVVTRDMDRPLRDLGAASANWALVRGTDRGAFLFHRKEKGMQP